MKGPLAGAGSQFDSLSWPGELALDVKVERTVRIERELIAITDGVTVDRIGGEELLFVYIVSDQNQARGPAECSPRVYRWNLCSLGRILVLDMEATNMPLTGPIPEGRSFFCPHCGALYAVTHSRLSKSDSNVAKCVVCGKIMDRWDSTDVRIFKLVHRPEDA